MTTRSEATTAARPLDRRVRRRAPEVGMWLRIQARHDKGGAPLIKVERIDERGWVFVTDWLDFDTEAPRDPLPGGYVPPRERTFAFDADDFSRRSLRYWKLVTPNPRSAPRREDGPHRNAEHHLHQTGSHAMKLLKFGAPWCKPCQALDKTLESANLWIEIEKVDIAQRPECAAEYRVRSVPTLVLLDDDGAEIDRRQGALSLGALLEFIEFDDLT